MLPGYNAFIGRKNDAFCCILVFNYFKKEKPNEDEAIFQGAVWESSLEEIDNTLQKAFPSAFIHFLTDFDTNYSSSNGAFYKVPSNDPFIKLATGSVLRPNSFRRVSMLTQKILSELA